MFALAVPLSIYNHNVYWLLNLDRLTDGQTERTGTKASPYCMYESYNWSKIVYMLMLVCRKSKYTTSHMNISYFHFHIMKLFILISFSIIIIPLLFMTDCFIRHGYGDVMGSEYHFDLCPEVDKLLNNVSPLKCLFIVFWGPYNALHFNYYIWLQSNNEMIFVHKTLALHI